MEITILSTTDQEIHATAKVIPSSKEWIISCIYASPNRNYRRILWDNLAVVAEHHNMPWLILGDFNEVLSSEDKEGGNQINQSRVKEYWDCMSTCNLMDLGYRGSRFTWSNLRGGGHLIRERLDRAWCNPSWQSLFPDCFVKHLPRTHSDHVLF